MKYVIYKNLKGYCVTTEENYHANSACVGCKPKFIKKEVKNYDNNLSVKKRVLLPIL